MRRVFLLALIGVATGCVAPAEQTSVAMTESPYVCKKYKPTGSHKVQEVCQLKSQSVEEKRRNEEFMKRNTHTVPEDRL